MFHHSKVRHPAVLGLCLAGAGLSCPALAQSEGAPIRLETIVVSPTGVPTRTEAVASSVTVITAEEIQRDQRRTLADILQSVPGLNVVQAGGVGGQTSVFMRGTNSNHVKVLIDGMDVSDPSTPSGAFDFGHLLASGIEQIEVLRGPQSGLYGSDAIGGVIAITTKRGEGPVQVAGTVEGGSFKTFNQHAAASGGNERFDFAFNLAHVRSDEIEATPPGLVPPGRPVLPNAYDNWTLSGKVGVQVADDLSARLIGRYTGASLRVIGDDFSVFPPVPAAIPTIQLDNQLFMRAEVDWTALDGRLQNTFGGSYSRLWKSVDEPDYFGPSPPSVTQGDRIRGDWRGIYALGDGQSLTGGVEYQNERLRTEATAAENANGAGFVQYQADLAGGLFVAANLRHDINQRFGGHTTWRIAPGYTLPALGTILRASYGTGVKAPTLSQLFVDFPAFGFFANPNLQPETSRGYDIGFEQPFADGRVRLGATWFHNDITNLINGTPTTYVNVGRATTQGVEAFAALQLGHGWSVRGDYTYTWAIDAVSGLELLRRPRHKGSLTVAWAPVDGLTLSASVLGVGSWIDGNRDFSIPRLTAPGYAVVNIAARHDIGEHATVFGRVDNLFDATYQDPVGFLRPGRAFYVGLTLRN